MASALRLATPISPILRPRARRAASTSSKCCGRDMTITWSTNRPWLTCATARSPGPSSPASASIPIASSPTARPGTFIWTNSASGSKGQPRSRDDRHRRRSVGQRQSPWFPRQCRDRQRRRRPIQRRPARPVLGPWRTPGSQTRYVHRGATRRAAAHPRPDLADLRLSKSLPTTSFPGAQGCLVGPVRPHFSHKADSPARPLAGA